MPIPFKSFPKPGKKVPPPPKPRAPKAKPQPKAVAKPKEKPSGSVKVKPPGIPAVKGKKPPKAGPTGKTKFKPVDEGLGTMFVKLTPSEIGERGKELAVQLQKREQEVDAQAETRSAMKARLDDFDNTIHRLGIAIREGREERKAPALFDSLDQHKEKPIAEDVMGKGSKKAKEPKAKKNQKPTPKPEPTPKPTPPPPPVEEPKPVEPEAIPPTEGNDTPAPTETPHEEASAEA